MEPAKIMKETKLKTIVREAIDDARYKAGMEARMKRITEKVEKIKKMMKDKGYVQD